MEIIIRNDRGVATFTTVAAFETFRNYCITRQKIYAIKFVRDTFQTWNVKEAKDFVEACDFPPVPVTTTLPPFDTVVVENFLSDIKDDIRSIILDKSNYRETLLLDLFARVAGRVGVR